MVGSRVIYALGVVYGCASGAGGGVSIALQAPESAAMLSKYAVNFLPLICGAGRLCRRCSRSGAWPGRPCHLCACSWAVPLRLLRRRQHLGIHRSWDCAPGLQCRERASSSPRPSPLVRIADLFTRPRSYVGSTSKTGLRNAGAEGGGGVQKWQIDLLLAHASRVVVAVGRAWRRSIEG